jgi:Uma2 family endonuclease
MPEKPGNPGYVLRRDPDTLRIPDASFVSWDRVPEGGVPDGYWPGAPDLAVEIVSPNGRADDVHDKVREYLEAGTKAVRVLWPKHRSVTAYARPDATVQDLGPEDELNGETRCPASG